jgi:hypothetical protein
VPISSLNKSDCHDITEMLLKVALNTINLTPIKININISGKDEIIINYIYT